MKALVIYDSFFGNTEQIARAMGDALAAQGEVEVLRVGDVRPEQLAGLNLLVVGSPTRGFRPSPATSKRLGEIPANALQGVKVAAFDTRISWADVSSPILRNLAKIFGFAAPSIAAKLTKKGGELALPPEGFYVKGTEGPLKEGELERAAAWAREIAGKL